MYIKQLFDGMPISFLFVQKLKALALSSKVSDSLVDYLDYDSS